MSLGAWGVARIESRAVASAQEDLLSTVLPARRPDQYGSQQQQRNSMGFDFQPHQRLSVDEAAKADPS